MKSSSEICLTLPGIFWIKLMPDSTIVKLGLDKLHLFVLFCDLEIDTKRV